MIEVKPILDAGLRLAEIRKDHGGIPFVVIPEGTNVHELEELLPSPQTTKIDVAVDDVESFTRYFNEHKSDDSRIFARLQETGAQFIGIIDFFGKGKTSWRKHRVTYNCPPTPEWLTWTKNNKLAMNQKAFAEFLEDNLDEIINPVGAEVLEIAKTLTAKTTVNFKSGIRLDNGNQCLTYEEMSETKAGEKGDLQIPTEITLGIAPFKSIQPYKLMARLKYRLQEGRVTFTYELVKPHKVIEDACKGIIGVISDKTSIQPFAGNAS